MRNILSIFITLIAVGFPAIAVAQGWQSPYALAANTPDQAPQGRFIISTHDVEEAISQLLIERDVASHIRATLGSNGKPVIFQSTEPMTMALHNVSINTSGFQWQAQAYVLSGGKTLSVVPVSGRYDVLSEVPVLLRHVSEGQVVRAEDVSSTFLPDRQLRNDVVSDASDLIGKTPRRGISAHRPIRASELTTPRLVEKGKTIELRYTTDYMSILGRGLALENGSLGETIRIKNVDSERTISARIVGINLAEANLAAPIETKESYKK